ncbi:acyl-ACP--UDP-N-acetylglucosamine O-acyltransferase [Flaviaesturariibacter aridisoli]|uniref:Acyl-ACP--UDP-N-acetylglucosamine O-acyltransferase n=1 Tax=Flaviaesturariibacter aridisoli TaxID=2545761 RepID=A0A4R4E5C5_9BACT|nr:acyl-ACP--UDP-N-acetylglucosamine O-acyltransferase [Flaviaesturariibacter aridisoli]TCZ74834.1 acyl-ACP--UDP-N-acetylglucosamine O-acyltransferase [Flaviaesturariibacter aridisoli]
MISPLAHVHPNAKIGNNVTIEAFSVVYEDVEIGDGTHIMPHVTVFDGARIGKDCVIFPGAVISAIPQDLKFVGEKTTAEIGDRTTIRECVTIHRGTKDKWTTKVGSDCLLMAYVHVAHDCLVGNHVILANAVQLAGHVQVDEYARIGGHCGVHQFIHIGAHTYVGAQLLIRKDIPPYVKAARDPLSFVGVNSVGLTRAGYTKESIDEISSIYHVLFVEKHPVSRSIELIRTNFPDTAIRSGILSFIEGSQAGIIKRYAKGGDED